MIPQFLILPKYINKSLIKLNFDPTSENDIFALQILVYVLTPVETAITKKSENDANLITVKGVNIFFKKVATNAN